MTENKRFTMDNPNDWDFPITDNVTGKVYNCASNILMKELCVVVNTIAEENEQLKQSVNNLKDTIIKITIAYQRKYDRNIVDLVHEVYDEDITDLIKELQE